jgi:HSP20 family protein
MKITKFNPVIAGRMGLSNLVDDFFNRGVTDFLGADFVFSRPSVNIHESEDNYQISLAAPGLKKEDFEVKLDGDTLVVSAQKSEKEEESNEKFTRREFNFSSFTRSFQLPKEIDVQKIAANYEKGILQLTLPKVKIEEQKNFTKIEIN